MRLRAIKLAGFKSFVDPTVINFPGDLVGIVGPNGCGKSNVIDAVRWVMGEISAKHLRGESMADVVFSGSNARHPVGQASVELIFDNSEGRLGGRYADYAEISVKRQVARDAAQSAYYLNGTRCRRRDVTDIFLGTGLGPRSYAIIEQGMISRLVEAKPDELREFLEEAAGISKYKERRRETESRIGRTTENLDRVNDLREELGKRLQHLKRQATMAEKYRVFKQEERHLRAQLLALRWRGLDHEAEQRAHQILQQETALEGALAAQRQLEASLERQRAAQSELSKEFNQTYRQVLDAGAEIARVEETIQHQRERREALQSSLTREELQLTEARNHLNEEETRLQELVATLGHEEPELARLQEAESSARRDFESHEQAMHEWQTEWQHFSERAAAPSEAAQIARARIEHLEQHLTQLEERRAALEAEHDTLDPRSLEREQFDIQAQLSNRQREHRELEATAAEHQSEIRALRESINRDSASLHERRQTLQEMRGRLSSLTALQQDALGKRAGGVMSWLNDAGLGDRPRLAEQLQVAPGWELALETVLGLHLEAVCVDDFVNVWPRLESLPAGALGFFAPSADAGSGGRRGAALDSMLRDKVHAPMAVASLVDGVHTAEDLRSALDARGGLGPGQSVVTRDGVWLGANWARVARESEDGAGVLLREQEMRQLAEQCAGIEAEAEAQHRALTSDRQHLAELEEAYASAQTEAAERHQELANLKSGMGVLAARLDEMRRRAERIAGELVELSEQAATDGSALLDLRSKLQQSLEAVDSASAERDALSVKRQRQRSLLEAARERWQTARDEFYELGLRAESMRAQLASLRTGNARDREQMTHLEAHIVELRETLAATEEPLAESQAALALKLAARGELDAALRVARERVEESESELRGLEQQRSVAERGVGEERATLERLRMEAQEVLVRRKTVQEQAEEAGHHIDELLAEMPEGADEATWEGQLETIERRIARLGPINLAAIEEYDQESERKSYLDAQYADLTDALTTLEEAIRKIDRETRNRFKETYEKVSAGLEAMFPRLFGGGAAYLQMTGEDLLSTGVSVMARPPGKRNTNISLLSGGEKALTAVALVFAIFELNPAPFCLLDEVDAPLDDANVGRFCELVKGMSERVQFVLVTHNKTTMEITQQLIGVTMNEPGVSRLVAVDVDEAVELAAV